MNYQPAARRTLIGWNSQTWGRLLNIAIPLAFLTLMLLFYPYRGRFQFDTDEGIQAMKAMLLARGYPLYDSIWSDHPPLFTYLLVVVFRLFGFEVNVGRALTLLFSTGLLASAFYLLRTLWSVWHALAGVLLIILLPYYSSLSVSIMIGLPAVALALVSLVMLIGWHKHRRQAWLVLSAIALALAILTKLYIVVLAPIFVLGLLSGEFQQTGKPISWVRLFTPAALWSLVFVCFLTIVTLVGIGLNNLPQMIGIHLAARGNKLFPGLLPISIYLKDVWGWFGLAILGCFWVIRTRNWLSLYLIAWVGASFLFLSFQTPIQYHHQLLLTVPLACLAAIAVGEAIRRLIGYSNQQATSPWSRWMSWGTLALATVVIIPVARSAYQDFSRPAERIKPIDRNETREQSMAKLIREYAEPDGWMVTDMPIHAFRAGLSTPPQLAVFSRKRVETGDLDQQQVIRAIEEYQPGIVLFGRFAELLPEVYLEQDYRLFDAPGEQRLFVRKDLVKSQ